MNRFLWGGWVARPCAFLFLRLRWFLVFGVGVVAMLYLVARVALGLSFAVAVLGSVALFQLVAMLNRVQPNRTLPSLARYPCCCA